MHRFAVVLVFAAVIVTEAAVTPEDLVKFGRARRDCDRSTPVDSSIIDRVISGEMINDRQFFCHAACIVKELGLVNADGSLMIDKIVSKIPEGLPNRDAIVNAANECGTKMAADPCDRAQMIFNCFHEKNVPSLLMG
ncbi:uncharacterized protein LOC123271924 [Cotesia glomerata]|uniref:Odorant-binding protein n=1 Tax=Cotesia glomerata TaxID=32391 RepID=A0AAV7ISZ9_COTGL|nr:uncharacterized protein LOC123271924 [Cotesia glomerata]KAH0557724.1 hypothetical protein KQX54_010818 [Cotesia glomerata]